MHQLTIKLNKSYKSFITGFETTLSGDLVILSGVNGSGKSQLADIIAHQQHQKRSLRIEATVKLNGKDFGMGEVIVRSFIESVNLNNFRQTDVLQINRTKDMIWNWYESSKLTPKDNDGSIRWSRQIKYIKNILIEKFGQEKFNLLSREEFERSLPDNINISDDDIFNDEISKNFHLFAFDKVEKQKEYSFKPEIFDSSILGQAPWEELNSVLKDLDLAYRFRGNFDICNGVLNHEVAIYPINNDGSLNYQEPRNISDLSTGEKAILSLITGTLFNDPSNLPKVIVLDEYDANFNPSLTQAFYKILDKHFIKRGIMIIFITHSISSIALAPNSAEFYELFKPDVAEEGKRIFRVQKEEYKEMNILELIFKKYSNTKKRYREVNSQEKLIMDTTNLPKLYVEGKTDKQYIEKAAELLNFNRIEDIEIICGDGSANLTNIYKGLLRSQRLNSRILVLHDCDVKKAKNESEPAENPILFQRAIDQMSSHFIKKGIENLFSNETIETARDGLQLEGLYRESIPDASKLEVRIRKLDDQYKVRLADWLCENGTTKDFKEFSKIFDCIKECLFINETK
jgi:ABC-type uncharacterized transport system ATPase subunit